MQRFRVCSAGVGVAVGLAAGSAGALSIRHDVDPGLIAQHGAHAMFDAVGRFAYATGDPLVRGSGTLVADRWVLTAASIVDGQGPLTFALGGQTYRGTGWTHPAGWDGLLANGYDLALVRLDRPAAGVAPQPLYRGGNELGQQGAIVGFGNPGTGDTGPAPGSSNYRQQGTNFIDEIRDGRVLMADFDDPALAASTLGGPFLSPQEASLTAGDGGGALLMQDGNLWALAGVTSYADPAGRAVAGSYGDLNGFTRVSAFHAWIDAVIAHEPLLRPLTFSPAWSQSPAADPEVPGGVLHLNDLAAAGDADPNTQDDLDWVLVNWGKGKAALGGDGVIAQAELDAVLLN